MINIHYSLAGKHRKDTTLGRIMTRLSYRRCSSSLHIFCRGTSNTGQHHNRYSWETIVCAVGIAWYNCIYYILWHPPEVRIEDIENEMCGDRRPRDSRTTRSLPLSFDLGLIYDIQLESISMSSCHTVQETSNAGLNVAQDFAAHGWWSSPSRSSAQTPLSVASHREVVDGYPDFVCNYLPVVKAGTWPYIIYKSLGTWLPTRPSQHLRTSRSGLLLTTVKAIVASNKSANIRSRSIALTPMNLFNDWSCTISLLTSSL
jgi:hypothetical protein